MTRNVGDPFDQDGRIQAFGQVERQMEGVSSAMKLVRASREQHILGKNQAGTAPLEKKTSFKCLTRKSDHSNPKREMTSRATSPKARRGSRIVYWGEE